MKGHHHLFVYDLEPAIRLTQGQSAQQTRVRCETDSETIVRASSGHKQTVPMLTETQRKTLAAFPIEPQTVAQVQGTCRERAIRGEVFGPKVRWSASRAARSTCGTAGYFSPSAIRFDSRLPWRYGRSGKQVPNKCE